MAETPGKMIALASVLTLLAMAAVFLRFHARRIKKTDLAWDDYMILPALLLTIGTAICMFVGSILGDLGRHSTIGPDGWPIVDDRIIVFEQINFASQLTQTLTFGFTKLAVLLFYNRIFGKGQIFSKLLWMMVGITIAWTISFFLANLLQCLPIWVNWTGVGGTLEACINTEKMYLAQAWSDVFTDVAILSLPIPSIWALQMPPARKAAVSGIFLLGALVIVAGAAKLVSFRRIAEQVSSGNNDITYVLTPTLYWPMVESSLGIVGACLPSMRPIFTGYSSQGFVRRLRSISYFSSTPSKTYNDHGEHVTRTSDEGSAITIAHTVPIKSYHPGGNPQFDEFFHAYRSNADLLDLEKQGGISEK